MLTFTIGNKGWKSKKCTKIWGEALPVQFRPSNNFWYRQQKYMKLFLLVGPTKNPITSQKNQQNCIYKGPGAVALILAFIAISKA